MTNENETPMKSADTDVSKKAIIEMKSLTKVLTDIQTDRQMDKTCQY